jgi:hypothetical protein
VLRGTKAAVIHGGGVTSGAVAPAFAREEGPAEQIAEALSRDVAPVTGKRARVPATRKVSSCRGAEALRFRGAAESAAPVSCLPAGGRSPQARPPALSRLRRGSSVTMRAQWPLSPRSAVRGTRSGSGADNGAL